MLHKAAGPECPGCGCQDSRVVGRVLSGGVLCASRVCTHCGNQWSSSASGQDHRPGLFDRAKSVIFPRLRCPWCRSKKVKTTSTQKPVRYHKCSDCGYPFKSVDP